MASDPADFSNQLIRRSQWDKPGFAGIYDDCRPSPPPILIDSLCRIIRVQRPSLVVDYGSGTGLSTRAWADVADRVVGIEANPAMCEEARTRTVAPNVEYRVGYGHETGLPGGCVDVVTCSQSLHWMPAQETFDEAARILRPGGVFAAYDYDVPPLVDHEIDASFLAMLERPDPRAPGMKHNRALQGLNPSTHLGRIRLSGRFRMCREFVVHATEDANVERLLGFARSLAGDEDILGRELEELEAVARRVFTQRACRILWSYRVRFGIT